MNNINKTLYIPLYGKAYVSKKGIILRDPTAEYIWKKEKFNIKGKSKSKWLAYFMAIRSAVFDEWTEKQITENPNSIVLHIGCGLDSRIKRVGRKDINWFDIDFPKVINERKKYYCESDNYHMVATDIRSSEWQNLIKPNQDVIIILEGLSMYLSPDELRAVLLNISKRFKSVKLLMDCYSERAAKLSKYKNPINNVGVFTVYGFDAPQSLALKTELEFEKEYCLTPQKFIDELKGIEKIIFKNLYAGKISKSLYRLYEFKKSK